MPLLDPLADTGHPDTHGRRLRVALCVSALLHALVTLWGPALPRGGSPQRLAESSLTVLLTDARSAPRAAASELAAPRGEGGGNSERPGHAESMTLTSEEDLPVAPAPVPRARLRAGDSQSLPTQRTMTSEGQRAPAKDSRQAESESLRGRSERGGDDCRVAGFRFCSS